MCCKGRKPYIQNVSDDMMWGGQLKCPNQEEEEEEEKALNGSGQNGRKK
jgi:hypothetical protein